MRHALRFSAVVALLVAFAVAVVLAPKVVAVVVFYVLLLYFGAVLAVLLWEGTK